MDSALVAGLLNAGLGGVVALLFVLGLIYPAPVVKDLKEERDAYKAALESERDRADAAVAAAQASRDLMAALQAGMALGNSVRVADALSPGGTRAADALPPGGAPP